MKLIKTKNYYKGFTLLEAILSSVILCAAVMAIGAISSHTLSDTKLNRQYETAISLMDKQFAIIDYMGISEFIKLGRTAGAFKGFEPQYSWEVAVEQGIITYLYDVSSKISWSDGGKAHSITAQTRYLAAAGSTE